MTSSGAAVSEQENSPRKMRSPQSLAASFAAVSGVSSWLTPTKTSRPGSPMAATTRWPTVTLAWLTRCTTARTFRRLLLLTSPGAVRPAIDAPGTPGGTAVKYLLMIYGNQEKWELMRELAPQVLGAMVRRYGQFGACEDAVQEAMLEAVSSWPARGVPDSPKGWLLTVASRRLIDEVRSEHARRRREQDHAAATAPLQPPGQPQAPGLDHDDSLALLFLCCHPALSGPSQIALTLRAVGGLSTAQIAAAFLVPEATMAQRISRAKEAIRASGAR